MNKQVAIFWDLDNTFWTLINSYGNVEFPMERIIDYLYEKYKDDSIRIFRAYADFEKLRSTMPDAQTIIQKRRVTPKHVFSSNAGSNDRKNAGDIELNLDAVETIFKTQEITEFVVISADKDMIPLINRLRYYDKFVNLIYLEAAIADDKLILSFPNYSTAIEEILKLDINTVKKTITEEDIKPHIETAIRITNEFYARNVEKPDKFFGNVFFIDDLMKSTKVPRNIASEVLEYCIKNDILAYDKTNPKKLIVPEKKTLPKEAS